MHGISCTCSSKMKEQIYTQFQLTNENAKKTNYHLHNGNG